MKPSDLATQHIHTIHVKLDLDIEFALPAQLTLNDRCDQCGAQALHAFAHPHNGGHIIFLFCNHHGRKHHAGKHGHVAHRDYRMNHTDWLKEAKDQQAKAQRDTRGQTSPHPPTPAHLAAWDLNHWA